MEGLVWHRSCGPVAGRSGRLPLGARARHRGNRIDAGGPDDRRASVEPGSPSHLWSLLRRAPNRTHVRLKVPSRPGRRARVAKLEVRWRQVTLDLLLKPSSVRVPVTLWAVRVHEVGRLSASVKRLEWVLLTDRPLEHRTQVLESIRWYTLRWRVEDHHKIWKRSGSDIEEMQLHSRAAMERWMAIHAAVSH